MKLTFTKMHGCGNDYIYFDCFEQEVPEPERLSVLLSDRHFGIGGDGIVLICPSDTADAKMRMFNADSSEGKMCGNAIRCVGKYLYEKKGFQDHISIETLSGVKHLSLHITDGAVKTVTVDMGKAEFFAEKIPVDCGLERVVNASVGVAGHVERITCVSMGNPHCVVYVSDPEALDLSVIGPQYEKDKIFPEGINTEFVKVISDTELSMRVWERGSGETLACGTGACAAVAASVENGYCPRDREILMHLLGGDLTIRYTDEAVYMTGPAQAVFTGEIDV